MQILPCTGSRPPVWKSKFYGAFVLNRRVVLHAIDATPARWRGDAGSSPLDGASAATSSPRNDLVKNSRVRPKHWLLSTQARSARSAWRARRILRWYHVATCSARSASLARMRRGSWRSAPCAGRRSSRRCVFIFRLVMKEVRRKKEERGKGRVQSSRVLGRTVVPRVFGLARLVRPLVDIIVVAASVLAPRGI